MLQLHSLLETLQMQTSRDSSGHFALFNCLMLGHTKYKGVQRIYCDPFPKKGSTAPTEWTLSSSVLLVYSRGFVLTPDSVWNCRVLLLFSMSALTDNGSKSYDCALVSTLETYATSKSGNYCNYCNYCNYLCSL